MTGTVQYAVFILRFIDRKNIYVKWYCNRLRKRKIIAWFDGHWLLNQAIRRKKCNEKHLHHLNIGVRRFFVHCQSFPVSSLCAQCAVFHQDHLDIASSENRTCKRNDYLLQSSLQESHSCTALVGWVGSWPAGAFIMYRIAVQRHCKRKAARLTSTHCWLS